MNGETAHIPSPHTSNIVMENAVIQNLLPGFFFETHLHHTTELFICLSGQLTMNIQNQTVPVNAGEYFLVFPNFPHSCSSTGKETCTILQIHFYCNLCMPVSESGTCDITPETTLFDFEIALGQRQYLTAVCSRQLEGCLCGIYDEYLGNCNDSSIMLYYYLQGLNILLSRELKETHRSDCQVINRYLFSACMYIKQHFSDHLTVTAVAQACGISPRYLSKLFHDHLQISVCSYIAHVRISKSVEFMRANPNYPMIKLALDLGFSSQQHFSAVFKEIMSVAPKRYFSLHQINK